MNTIKPVSSSRPNHLSYRIATAVLGCCDTTGIIAHRSMTMSLTIAVQLCYFNIL